MVARRITKPWKPRTKTHAGQYRKNHKKRGGRKKGTPNRWSAGLRAAIEEAIHIFGKDGKGYMGAVGYFLKIAGEDTGLMVRLIEKCMPTQLTGPADGPIKIMALPTAVLKGATEEQLALLESLYSQVAAGLLTAGTPVLEADANSYAALLESPDPKDGTRH